MMSMKCRSCNTTFQDNGSLEIHYQYTHSAGKDSNSSQDSSNCREIPDASESTETNNNQFFKFENICHQGSTTNDHSNTMTAISPGISSHSGNETTHGNRADNNFSVSHPIGLHDGADLVNCYNLNHIPPPSGSHNYVDNNYILGGTPNDFPRVPPHSIISTRANSTTSPINIYSYTNNDQRYHPYYKPGFRDPRNQMPGSPIMPPHIPTSFRCDKCDYICPSQDMLIHHYNMVHGTLALHPGFNSRFPNSTGAEPQAEILDLDSHKVHVYQPPNSQENHEEERQNPGLGSWMSDSDKKYYPPHLPQQNGRANGRGGTPLASPDFGSVSTTTDNIENLQSTVHSPFHANQFDSSSQFDSSNQSSGSVSVGPPANHITSSDGPSGGKGSGKSGKSGNGSWKSNEPRRPKTYNCSACNKWFTSSGHLKRHYNTTLHKNAVKQSGGADPATLPISVHHHPHKDPTYVPSNRHSKSSPSTSTESTSSSEPVAPIKVSDRSSFSSRTPSAQAMTTANSFLHSSPNLMAGPSDIPGGLLRRQPHPSYTTQCNTPELIKSPSPILSGHRHSNHSNYLPFTTTQTPPPPAIPFFQHHTQTPLYPNFQSPHVSTTQQVTTINHSGNSNTSVLNTPIKEEKMDHVLDEDADSESFDLLPNFLSIQKINGSDVWNNQCTQYFGIDQFFGTLNSGNVGGYFSKISPDENTPPKPTIIDVRNSVNGTEKDEDLYSPDSFALVQHSGRKNKFISCSIKQELAQELDLPFDMDSDLKDPLEESSLYDDENTDVSSSTVDSIQQTPSPPEITKGPFLCEKCHKAFNKACYLTQHNKSFHSGFKPFKCNRCGKRFTEAKQYKDHTEKHAGDKPHKCEICPKQFNHKTDLRRHVCLHTNIRPHTCDLCQKGFIRKDHMLKHRETHVNKKQQEPRRMKIQKIKQELEMEILC